jgi:HlyD family secretion protein
MSLSSRTSSRMKWGLASLLLLAALGIWYGLRPPQAEPKAAESAKSAAAKPALSVNLIAPEHEQWPRLLAANGNIVAWQESVISAEISNYRLTEVLVNVGDTVRKGQLLARISSDTVAAEVAQSRASVAEAEANLADAQANAERARQLVASGFYSTQLANQYLTGEQTALARLNAARARLQADEVRLAQTWVHAPDAGVISARAATLGSLAQPGVELFRLIRGGRLEWRAELPEADLARVKPGMAAALTAPNGAKVTGRVRGIGPTVDPQTRNGLVYVDLPAVDAAVRAGMFARGEFDLGAAPALTLPQTAVLLREGFAYVFRVGNDYKVAQTKVAVGRRFGERIEILAGLDPAARVAATGAGFLADGDTVRVVEASAAK